jgi:methylthioribose-1-phosphate isomerase
MKPDVIAWTPSGAVRLLDQTRLPDETSFLEIDQIDQMISAIKALSVRGAPLLGVAAAMGLAAAAARREREGDGDLDRWFRQAAASLAEARPTAVNLQWAVDRVLAKVAAESQDGRPLSEILREEAQEIWDEDARMCDSIGRNGAEKVPQGATIMTHCNAGRLATGGIGTALGVIYSAQNAGKDVNVFARETRPLNQGSRLTAWELIESGVPCTVIADSVAGSLMADGKIDMVVVGADRIAANGDAANKIGTYPLAVLADAHSIPFYVAAPVSTFDMTLASGAEIPIELRSADEMPAAAGASVHNPAFDVTPARLINAIFTDLGTVEKPGTETVREILAG